jgi:hypothetical protein
MPFQYFLCLRIIFLFLATELKWAKKWMSGGKGCMYINNWFKSIFPLFLTSHIHKLKFHGRFPLQCQKPSYAYSSTYVKISLENRWLTQINQQNHEKWEWEKLIPNLKLHLVMVLDNMAYHNVILNKESNSTL